MDHRSPLRRGLTACALILGLGIWTAAFAGTINTGPGAGGASAFGTSARGGPNLTAGAQPSAGQQGAASANYNNRYGTPTGPNGGPSQQSGSTSVPEPPTWLLLCAGLGLVAWSLRRRGLPGAA
ncbi:MAG: PEP-CTERM sorting domain-containing protein [Terriglobales bacterium]